MAAEHNAGDSSIKSRDREGAVSPDHLNSTGKMQPLPDGRGSEDRLTGRAARPGLRPRRKWLIFTILLLCAISAAGYLRLRVDTSLEPLLPEGSQARNTVIFLRDSSFAAKGVLWFRLTGEGDLADLMAASDAAEKKLDKSLIKRVITPPREADALQEMLAMLDHAGEMLSENDLAELDKATEPAALKQRMRDVYVQLTKPEGSFMQQIIQRDPLGVNSRVLARLYELSNGLGYRMEVKNGHFVHPDGKQLLLIFETGASATNLEGSKALVKHLDEIIAGAPENVSITPIAPQVHTKQNDELMHSDMQRAGTIDVIAFLALFLLVCRDWRVAAVFFLPIAATAITIGLCGLTYPTLSVMVIGLSATMAGSAVDYGIFVYTAIKTGHDWHDDVKRIRKHLLLSLLTTLGVFVAFLFSDIPAYRQLGYLTSVSLILAMLGAVFVLPQMIKPGGKILALGTGMPLHRWGKWTSPLAGLAIVAFAIAAIAVRGTRFDPDVTRLDGASAEVKQSEKDFQKAWGRSDDDLAILVVTGKTLDEAERKNDEITQLMTSNFDGRPFTSLSSFWPSTATRKANLARWQNYWTDDRIASLKHDLVVAGEPYGFDEAAFDPFFTAVYEPPREQPSRQVLSSIEEQFVARSNGEYQILSYFEDTDENVRVARDLLKDHPDVQVISRRALGQAFAESASSENRILVGISVSFIAISLLALTRSPIKSILIMLPAAAAIVSMLVTLKVLSLPLSVVSVIAGILVIGLSSDYGIFAVFAWDEDETMFGHGMTSMHLSSATTLIGTTSLLFANHPALHLVGVSLTSGLLVGYLTALLVVPGICFVIDRIKKRHNPETLATPM